MVSGPPVRGILQGGQQVSSTIQMYTEKRGRGTILVAIESICSCYGARPVLGASAPRGAQL